MGDAHAEHAPEGLVEDPTVAWGTLGAHVVTARGARRACGGGGVSVRSLDVEHLQGGVFTSHRPSAAATDGRTRTMAKKNRRAAGAKRGIDMNTDARPPAEANPAVVVQKPSNKRKSITKLSSKQKARKKEKQRRGEARNDKYSTKTVRDAKKLQRVLTAKALW
jgi:hypothetical protein